MLTSFTLVFGVKIAQSILHRGLKAAKCAKLSTEENLIGVTARWRALDAARSAAAAVRRPACLAGGAGCVVQTWGRLTGEGDWSVRAYTPPAIPNTGEGGV